MSETEKAGGMGVVWLVLAGAIVVGGGTWGFDPFGWRSETADVVANEPVVAAAVVPDAPAASLAPDTPDEPEVVEDEAVAAVVPDKPAADAPASSEAVVSEPTEEIAPEAPIVAEDAAEEAEVVMAPASVPEVATAEIAVSEPEATLPVDSDSAETPSETVVAAPAPEATSEAQDSMATASVPDGNNVQVSAATDPSVSAATPTASSQPLSALDAAPTLPEFDLVRVDAEGAGLVAGRAEPGSRVRVFSNGSEIATAEADAKGEFVAFIQTPASDEGQVLSLIANSQSGVSAEGGDTVLLLPVSLEGTQEASAPAVLRKDAAGETVRVVNPGGLGKVERVSLDAITYNETGDVVLSGRTPRAQPLRIYVDGSVVMDATSSEAGTWDVVISGIDAGRYVLRVDALDASGGVESRVESPFQRVFPTAEERASLSQITVQPGNTLWVMAEERYGNGFQYTQIFAANRGLIRDPDLIYPGQILSLPEGAE